MSDIEKKFLEKTTKKSDINEHLPTLRKYSLEVNHITECGVRSVVSSYAFASGLLKKENNKLIQVDICRSKEVTIFQEECKNEGINTIFYQKSDLDCPLEMTDLLFIDTWHVYGHLKRELERWHPYVSKYIVMHDTTIDEWKGETIRCNRNAEKQSKQSGIPLNELFIGLWPAIEEFLKNHEEWKIKERFTNNNGLTILERMM